MNNYKRCDCDTTTVNQDDLIIAVAPILEEFLGKLFNIKDQIKQLQTKYQDSQIIAKCRTNFIRRVVSYRFPTPDHIKALDQDLITKQLYKIISQDTSQVAFCEIIMEYLKDKEQFSTQLEIFTKFCAIKLHSKEHNKWELFNLPKVYDQTHPLQKLDNITYQDKSSMPSKS